MKIGWIPGAKNPADALTKPILTTTKPVLEIMRDFHFDLEPEEWAASRGRETEMLECGKVVT